MADLLIRGANLPEHCGKCQFMADGWCYAVSQRQDDFVSFDRRPDFCPLVEVPDHGRLIDADALLSKDRNIYRADGAAIGKNPYISTDEIDEADTIIPASKEDKS